MPQRFKTDFRLLENINEGVLATDDTGVILATNPSLNRLFGYEAGDLIGQNVMALMPDHVARDHPGYVSHFLDTGKSQIVGLGRDLKGQKKNGELISLYISVSEIPADDDERHFIAFMYDNTKEKGAQKEIENQRGFFKSILDSNPDAIVIADTERNIITLNPAFHELFGYDCSEVIGRKTSILYAEEKAYVAQGHAVFNKENPGINPTKAVDYKTKAGSVFSGETVGAAIKNSDGELLGFIGVIRDITDRLKFEKALTRQETELRTILDTLPAMVFTKNVNTLEFVEFNKFGQEIMGKSHDELIGKTNEDLFPVGMAKFVTLTDREVIASKKIREFPEVYMQTSTGEKVLHTRKTVIKDENGDAKYLLGISVDITEEKRLESELKASHVYNRTLIDNTPVGCALCEMDGSHIEINQAYADIIGYTKEEVLKLTYWDVTPTAYEEQEAEQLKSLQKTGHYGPYEKEYIHKDGHLIPVRLNGLIVHLNDRDYIWSTIDDITKSKKIEYDLNLAKESAEKANRAKSEFLSSMSHELRTPLNAILGFSQLMLIGKAHPLSDKQTKQVSQIRKAGQHLLELIDKVLDLAKIEAGKISLSIEAINFYQLLDECCQLTQSQAADMSVEIYNLVDDQDLWIKGDILRSKQVMLNLMSNAVKYNKKKGEIWLETAIRNDGFVRFSVRDTGGGIAPEFHENVFQPFSRLDKENSEIEGTGIGLVVTKTLIEEMGGRIGFESQVDVGTVFWLDFPVYVQHEKQITGPKEEIYQQGESIESQGKRVLYVEDNPANLNLMEEFIYEYPNIDLFSCTTAEEGLILAEQHLPDVILMDINLPGMGGVEAVRELKKNPITSGIPILAVSANAMQISIDEAKAAGVVDYITKPLHFGKLMAALSSALNVRL